MWPSHDQDLREQLYYPVSNTDTTQKCIATYDLVKPSGLMFLLVITRLAVGPMAARAPTTYGNNLNKVAEGYIDLLEF